MLSPFPFSPVFILETLMTTSGEKNTEKPCRFSKSKRFTLIVITRGWDYQVCTSFEIEKRLRQVLLFWDKTKSLPNSSKDSLGE